MNLFSKRIYKKKIKVISILAWLNIHNNQINLRMFPQGLKLILQRLRPIFRRSWHLPQQLSTRYLLLNVLRIIIPKIICWILISSGRHPDSSSPRHRIVATSAAQPKNPQKRWSSFFFWENLWWTSDPHVSRVVKQINAFYFWTACLLVLHANKMKCIINDEGWRMNNRI